MSKKSNRSNVSKKNQAAAPAYKKFLIMWAVLIIFSVLLITLTDNISLTLSLWEASTVLIIVGIVLVAAAVAYRIFAGGKNASSALFPPKCAIFVSALFLVWSVVFKAAANRYFPIFLALNIVVIVLSFVYISLGKDFFGFSLYTAFCAAIVWFFKLFSVTEKGAFGVIATILALVVMSGILLAVYFGSKKGSDIKKEKIAELLDFDLLTVLCCAVTLAVCFVSLILSLIITGYEIYFLTALLMLFIICGIIRAVRIIEA